MGNWNEASEYFQEAINIVNEKTPHYLVSLDGYISSCHKGKLLSNEKLIELTKEGLYLAKSTKSDLWISFQLHLYQLEENDDQYFQFIETTVLPRLRNIGFTNLIEHYEKKLFRYYNQKGDTQKALEHAASYIQGREGYYAFK